MKELTRILHDLDQGNINADEAEGKIIELIDLKCKETAKNVRHKACDIINEYDGATDVCQKDIMNIKFDDVKPR